MKLEEWAVTLSILLHVNNSGIFLLTTSLFVSMSYKYLYISRDFQIISRNLALERNQAKSSSKIVDSY